MTSAIFICRKHRFRQSFTSVAVGVCRQILSLPLRKRSFFLVKIFAFIRISTVNKRIENQMDQTFNFCKFTNHYNTIQKLICCLVKFIDILCFVCYDIFKTIPPGTQLTSLCAFACVFCVILHRFRCREVAPASSICIV